MCNGGGHCFACYKQEAAGIVILARTDELQNIRDLPDKEAKGLLQHGLEWEYPPSLQLVPWLKSIMIATDLSSGCTEEDLHALLRCMNIFNLTGKFVFINSESTLATLSYIHGLINRRFIWTDSDYTIESFVRSGDLTGIEDHEFIFEFPVTDDFLSVTREIHTSIESVCIH
jgi:hypothetical protein